VMKMPNGGFNPAVNVQLATDTESRAIVGVEVSHEGSDSAGLSEPMREQVEQRSGGQVEQQLLDGGYLRRADIEQAYQQGVQLFVPPKPARQPRRRGRELEPKPGDSPAVLAWKRRMASAEGQEIYRQRAATSETVNADLRSYRGLTPLTVRGLAKAKCVALWCAMAYNVMHFGRRCCNEASSENQNDVAGELSLETPAHVPRIGSTDHKYDQRRCAGRPRILASGNWKLI